MDRENDQCRFSNLMQMMGKIFNDGKEQSPSKIEVYFEVLQDLTIEQVENSVKFLIENREYPGFPLPAHIRKNIRLVDKIDPQEAWGLVIKWFEGGSKPKDHISLKAVENLGGFETISRYSYDQQVWVKRDFERLYKTLDERRDIFKAIGPKKPHLKIVEKNPG